MLDQPYQIGRAVSKQSKSREINYMEDEIAINGSAGTNDNLKDLWRALLF